MCGAVLCDSPALSSQAEISWCLQLHFSPAVCKFQQLQAPVSTQESAFLVCFLSLGTLLYRIVQYPTFFEEEDRRQTRLSQFLSAGVSRLVRSCISAIFFIYGLATQLDCGKFYSEPGLTRTPNTTISRVTRVYWQSSDRHNMKLPCLDEQWSRKR